MALKNKAVCIAILSVTLSCLLINRAFDQQGSTNTLIRLDAQRKFQLEYDWSDAINVVFSVDDSYLKALPTVINSIRQHTMRKLQFYVIFTGMDEPDNVRQFLTCYFGDLNKSNIKVQVIQNASAYIDPILQRHIRRRTKEDRNLLYTDRESNYLRFYLHRILPDGLARFIYIDADMLVFEDLGKLWDLTAQHGTIFSAVYTSGTCFTNETDEYLMRQGVIPLPRGPVTCSRLGHSKPRNHPFPVEWAASRLGLKLPRTFFPFQCGVLVMNLKKFRERESKFMERLRVWAEGDIEYSWFKYSTQVLMSYTYFDEMTPLSEKWNLQSFKLKKVKSTGNHDGRLLYKGKHAYLKPAILHFSGEEKPWKDKHEFKIFWEQMKILKCSGNGSCPNITEKKGSQQGCICYNGSRGANCNETPK